MVDALVAPRFGAGVGSLAGALAFAIGVVFLVVGRSELFTENFFDPVAAAIQRPGRRPWTRLLRLWGVTLVLNLVGGALLVALLTVDGALPTGAADTLSRLAEEIASKGRPRWYARSWPGPSSPCSRTCSTRSTPSRHGSS
ncbi:formate/nitrite transporter family protein [Blastococcus litoris]|uniref:formate/nitrite transporter family protein n=1 Tax=Blastococcus litoris TaxID=2171622 RepID=UPI0019D26D38|nr:formate/nitrite transporter family protein [Blastococcus litoris]